MAIETRAFSINWGIADVELFLTAKSDAAGTTVFVARTSIGTTDDSGWLIADVSDWNTDWRGLVTIDDGNGNSVTRWFDATVPTAAQQQANATAALTAAGLDSTSVSELGEAVAAVSERVMTALPAAEPGTEGAGLALSGEGASESKQDQLIALFQQGLPDVAPGQQRGARRIVRGDTYSSDGRSLLITRHKNAEWPENLGDWVFSFEAQKHPDNTNAGDALAGTVEVVTATGSARGVRLVFTAEQTQAAALGRHLYAVRATLADDADVVWTVEMGSIEVESATE